MGDEGEEENIIPPSLSKTKSKGPERLYSFKALSFVMMADMVSGYSLWIVSSTFKASSPLMSLVCISALKEEGLRVYDSEANYIFFRGEPELYDRLLEKGYLIRDCSNYPGLGKGYFRAAVRLHEDNVGFLKALKEVRGETWRRY